ncbi:MAG: redoxin domain-containing protein [Chloroflexi bacterium]|nr:redoxin domain-containing protein [Chloroflexota bacterium]
MTEEAARIRAPELTGGYWVNSEPLIMESLRGRPLLIDFWDYTCINCIHTLPYLVEWHRRYSPLGLTIVGVHAPEFSFAKQLDGVKRAIEEFGIEYPVVMDNDFAIWRAYANRYWPAKYLVDGEGYIRYYHFGEGAYVETEQAIQGLVREVRADAPLLEPVQPVRDEDRPGAACYRVTPELYLGYQRGRIGNPGGYVPKKGHVYRDPGRHAEGYFYLEGEWAADEEQVMKPWGSGGESRVSIRYTAKEVNLVTNPSFGRECRVWLAQDGTPLAGDDAGADVRFEEDGRSYVDVDTPRMCRLVNNRELDSHDLTLATESAGLALYAFTFVSCVVPEEQA